MTEVRAATADMFEEVYELLLDFRHPCMTREDWRRMLFDYPWPAEEPTRGFVLVDRGRVVGFIGTIFSTRRRDGSVHRFCNLSSWIVKETHRGASFQLLLPILAMRSHTIVNFSASPAAHEIFSTLGFRTLEDRQFIIPLVPGPMQLFLGLGWRVVTEPDEVRQGLPSEGREIFDHMKDTQASHLLVRQGSRSCHVVGTVSPWKKRWDLAQVLYASDWQLLWSHLMPVAVGFARILRTAGLRLDGRRATGPRPFLARERRLPQPLLFRPASPEVTPEMIDGLYSELVGMRWRGHQTGIRSAP